VILRFKRKKKTPPAQCVCEVPGKRQKQNYSDLPPSKPSDELPSCPPICRANKSPQKPRDQRDYGDHYKPPDTQFASPPFLSVCRQFWFLRTDLVYQIIRDWANPAEVL
jgi:hypothetical protein